MYCSVDCFTIIILVVDIFWPWIHRVIRLYLLPVWTKNKYGWIRRPHTRYPSRYVAELLLQLQGGDPFIGSSSKICSFKWPNNETSSLPRRFDRQDPSLMCHHLKQKTVQNHCNQVVGKFGESVSGKAFCSFFQVLRSTLSSAPTDRVNRPW